MVREALSERAVARDTAATTTPIEISQSHLPRDRERHDVRLAEASAAQPAPVKTLLALWSNPTRRSRLRRRRRYRFRSDHRYQCRRARKLQYQVREGKPDDGNALRHAELSETL